jgi:hypothetical protein
VTEFGRPGLTFNVSDKSGAKVFWAQKAKICHGSSLFIEIVCLGYCTLFSSACLFRGVVLIVNLIRSGSHIAEPNLTPTTT